ncbi:TetR/AcrR family transcriptional regulator [Streptomyces sp. NPDC088747]|uniref:TetR/AcrR family transcriptional regulator n=1 Tax=Streptomyces sp. NPDC088747 TaxID=3365886 RepID=UPI00380D7A97
MSEQTDESVASSSTPREAGRPRNRSARQLEESARHKARIVQEAMIVFAEAGFAQTTLADIGKRVGLSRQGILHHFPSKDALFEAVIEELHAWGRAQVERHLTGDGLPAMRELAAFLGRSPASRVPLRLIHVLEGEAAAGNPAALAYTARRSQLVRAEVRVRLERSVADGEIAPGTDVEAVSTLVAAAINGLQTQWLLEPDIDTIAAFDVLLTTLTAQLAPRKV